MKDNCLYLRMNGLPRVNNLKENNRSITADPILRKLRELQGKRKISEIKHTPKTPRIPVLESIKLGEGWKVHYSANTYKVDFLFLEEGRNNVESVTLEDIRLKLLIEEDAAELTASGTKWRYDIEQKLLFPDAWGEDKGLC